MAKPVVRARSFTAAGRRVDLSSKTDIARNVRPPQDWQDEAFTYLDEVGEVAYAANYIGQVLSQLRVYAAEMPADPGEKPEATANSAANAAVADLEEGEGIAAIMREVGVNFQVAGEAWLVGRQSGDEGQIWEVRSVSEVARKDNDVILLDRPDARDGIKVNESEDGGDFMARLWVRHPRFSELATSPLRPVLSVCEELLLSAKDRRAYHRSRLPSKILGIPSGASFGPDDPTRDGESGDDDPLSRDLILHMSTPIQDEGSAAALVPFLLRLDREDLEAVRVIDVAREKGNMEDDERLVRRLAQGLNLPVEILLGIASANHWGGGVIEEQTFRAHIEPIAILILRSLTRAYLWPTLKSANVANFKDFVMHYDASALIIRENLAQNSKDAHAAIIISDARHREDLGYTEDDAPTPEEAARREERAKPRTADRSPLTASAPLLIPATTGTAQAPMVTLTAAAPSRLGRDLLNLDRNLRTAIHASAERLHDAALTKAGARIRSKVKSNRTIADTLASTPNAEVALTLGPAVIRQLGFDPDALLTGAFDALEQPFVTGCRNVADAALSKVPRLSDAEAAEARAEQTRDIADAWGWLRGALAESLSDALFALHVEPTEGETDGSAVSLQVIREALARAGGGTQGETAAIETLFSVILSGGIGTGRFMRWLFARKGVITEGFEWEYGLFHRVRPFNPHRHLDGVTFANFDDPVLANPNTFPPEPFFVPGDHAGCRCDVIPVLRAVVSSRNEDDEDVLG